MSVSPTTTSALADDSTAEKLVRFRLAGVRVASSEEQAADQARVQESLLGAFSDGRLNPDRLHTPASSVVPVYEDPDGQRFLGISTPFGPRMIPMRDTPVWDPQSDPSGAGFWSAEAMQDLAITPQLENPQVTAARMTQAAMQALPASKAEDGASLVEAFLQSSGMGLAQQLAGDGLLLVAGGGNPAGLLNQFVAAPGSGFDLAKLGQNLASGLISKVMNMGIQSLMSNWQVDDESSTAEHAAQRAAQALIGKLQGELMNVINKQLAKALGTASQEQLDAAAKAAGEPQDLSTKIKEFFTGPTSTANIPVGRKGDKDSNDGKAEMGAATVLANGEKVTRQRDGVSMTVPSVDLGPLMSGNPIVLTQTLPTAGKGHYAVGLSKGIVTLLEDCSPRAIARNWIICNDWVVGDFAAG